MNHLTPTCSALAVGLWAAGAAVGFLVAIVLGHFDGSIHKTLSMYNSSHNFSDLHDGGREVATISRTKSETAPSRVV